MHIFTYQEWKRVSQDRCLILSTLALTALTAASISFTLEATCSHSGSCFRILHPEGNWSGATGVRYCSSIRPDTDFGTGVAGCNSVPSACTSVPGVFKAWPFGQHSINQDSCSRITTHCMARYCNLSVHCWTPSWGGNATSYSLEAFNLPSISWMQLKRFLFRDSKVRTSLMFKTLAAPQLTCSSRVDCGTCKKPQYFSRKSFQLDLKNYLSGQYPDL